VNVLGYYTRFSHEAPCLTNDIVDEVQMCWRKLLAYACDHNEQFAQTYNTLILAQRLGQQAPPITTTHEESLANELSEAFMALSFVWDAYVLREYYRVGPYVPDDGVDAIDENIVPGQPQ